MKIYVKCSCIVLQKTFELFLDKYLSDENECDFVVTDDTENTQKKAFLVGENSAYLKIPFSPEQLKDALSEFYFTIQNSQNFSVSSSLESQILEKFENFKAEILEILRKNNA